MRKLTICLLLGAWCAVSVKAGTIDLGSTDRFAVLAGQTVTNTGLTVVTGDLGVWPGTAITGFGPGIVHGSKFVGPGPGVAMTAQGDLTTAYNFAAGEGCNTVLTGQDLGGMTLSPGVYCFSSSAQLTGTLFLDGSTDPTGQFVFQIGTKLTTAPISSVVLIGGAVGDNVFWQVGSSATLDTGTAFTGNILALTSIALNTGASLTCGRALARNGAVTLQDNAINAGEGAGCESAPARTPEPGTLTLSLFSMGSFGIAFLRSKRR